MKKIHVATFSIDGDAIRIVFIGLEDLEAAREAALAPLPQGADVQITLHEVSADLAQAMNLGPGETQEWWLGGEFTGFGLESSTPARRISN